MFMAFFFVFYSKNTGSDSVHCESSQGLDNGLTDHLAAILEDKSHLLQRRQNQVANEPDPFEIMRNTSAAKDVAKEPAKLPR